MARSLFSLYFNLSLYAYACMCIFSSPPSPTQAPVQVRVQLSGVGSLLPQLFWGLSSGHEAGTRRPNLVLSTPGPEPAPPASRFSIHNSSASCSN